MSFLPTVCKNRQTCNFSRLLNCNLIFLFFYNGCMKPHPFAPPPHDRFFNLNCWRGERPLTCSSLKWDVLFYRHSGTKYNWFVFCYHNSEIMIFQLCHSLMRTPELFIQQYVVYYSGWMKATQCSWRGRSVPRLLKAGSLSDISRPLEAGRTLWTLWVWTISLWLHQLKLGLRP